MSLLRMMELEAKILSLIEHRWRRFETVVLELCDTIGSVPESEIRGRIDFLINRGCIATRIPKNPLAKSVNVMLSPWVPSDWSSLVSLIYGLHAPSKTKRP